MAYPTVLRQKALDYYQECKNLSQVSRVFGISLFALKQWVKLQKQTGSLEHRIKGGNATKVDKEKLLQYLAEHPDAYQYEIAEYLGCTASNVCYLLKTLGITRKKRPQATKSKTQSK